MRYTVQRLAAPELSTFELQANLFTKMLALPIGLAENEPSCRNKGGNEVLVNLHVIYLVWNHNEREDGLSAKLSHLLLRNRA